MGWVDKRSEFAAGQHVVAGTTASTSFINLGGDFDIGPGSPLWLVFSLDTDALAGATPTYTFYLQTDDNSSFSSPEDLLSFTITQGTLAGTRRVFGFPWTNQKYLRIKAVLADGGASADVTYSAYLTDNLPSAYQAYPQNLNN